MPHTCTSCGAEPAKNRRTIHNHLEGSALEVHRLPNICVNLGGPVTAQYLQTLPIQSFSRFAAHLATMYAETI